LGGCESSFGFFGFLFSVGAIALVLGAVAGGYFYWQYSRDLPDHAQLANYEPAVTTRVHSSDGSLLAEYSRERRLYLPIQAVPKLVIDAFLSAEDKNFYKHNGIDPEGVVRAAVNNFRSGKKQGASTITQQVAKNFLLSNEQTSSAKFGEALIASRSSRPFQGPDPRALTLNEIFRGTLVPAATSQRDRGQPRSSFSASPSHERPS
jgi:penicillin-binding protein 1A